MRIAMHGTTKVILGTACALAMTVPMAMAQTAAPAPTPPTASPSQPHFSHTDIHKTGRALKKVLAINNDYRNKITATNSQTKQQNLRSEAIKAETDAVRSEGISVAKYSQVLTAARTNPTLREQVLSAAHLNQK